MKKPKLFKKQSDITSENVRKLPMVGRENVVGYKFIRYWFVDSSGFGQEGEAAFTFPQFLNRMQPGYAYGIVNAGQFQVNIGQWQKV